MNQKRWDYGTLSSSWSTQDIYFAHGSLCGISEHREVSVLNSFWQDNNKVYTSLHNVGYEPSESHSLFIHTAEANAGSPEYGQIRFKNHYLLLRVAKYTLKHKKKLLHKRVLFLCRAYWKLT